MPVKLPSKPDAGIPDESVTPVTSIEDKEPLKVKAKVSESDQILKQLAKEKGQGLFLKGNQVPQVNRVSTGVFEFDYWTRGGFPEGRLSIVYGPESSGKSNLCFLAVASVQKRPKCNKAVWVDLEGTFDAVWAAALGVDVEALLVVKPGYGEEAVDIIDALVRADDVGIIVVDSIAVLTSAKEAEQSVEKFDVGTASVLVKRLSNKLAIAFSKEMMRGHFPTVLFINQTRFKIGVMFGDPETMPGGQTMKFLSSLTVRLYGKNKIVKEISPDLPAFKDTNVTIKKAKVPINGASFSYEMAMIPNDILNVGETNSWSAVAAHLRAANKIRKDGSSWVCSVDGKDLTYGTLAQIQEHYQTDRAFQSLMQKAVLLIPNENGFLLEAEGLAAK